MTGPLPIRLRLMPLLTALALVAIVVRGLVPAGYMIAAADEPGEFISVEICHGADANGTQTLYLDPRTGEYHSPEDLPKEDGKHDPGSTCPFALSAHFALPEITGTLLAAPLPALTQTPVIADVAPGRGLAAPPPPPRAPPFSA